MGYQFHWTLPSICPISLYNSFIAPYSTDLSFFQRYFLFMFEIVCLTICFVAFCLLCFSPPSSRLHQKVAMRQMIWRHWPADVSPFLVDDDVPVPNSWGIDFQGYLILKFLQELVAEALSQDTERLEIDITLGAGAVDGTHPNLCWFNCFLLGLLMIYLFYVLRVALHRYYWNRRRDMHVWPKWLRSAYLSTCMDRICNTTCLNVECQRCELVWLELMPSYSDIRLTSLQQRSQNVIQDTIFCFSES